MPERFDIIIVGSGIAGLSAAYEASRSRRSSIALIEKSDSKDSNSYFAQGGIAAAIGKNDSWKKHYEDTIAAGCGLCNEQIVELITKNGPIAIKELQDLGLEFDGGKNPDLGLEGGHCKNRVLHIKGDQTGKELTSFMRKIVSEKGNVSIIDRTFAQNVSINDNQFYGVFCKGSQTQIAGSSLVVATGGYAAVFEKTTNPQGTLGSGIAIANRAGCELKGMEFIQFHPTTLRADIGGNYLVSEAVRGEGGKIVDENGRAIVNPLDTRDKVSIAIYKQIQSGGKAFLDCRKLEAGFFKERFPSVFKELLKNKINPEKNLIPIETAAHYTIGGIKTDINCLTNVRGIFAAGECANSLMHGANRLASNSLLEGLVMGKIAGRNATAVAKRTELETIPTEKEREGTGTKIAFEAMKKIMWRCCGVIRDQANLKDGLAGIKNLVQKIEINETIESIIARDSLLVCEKTIEAAILRKESIGAHYRTI
ncbi:MAG TPA: FAD-dependent oxidoreductase [archaeon]|nr:FAD-dependent oxidoreductase [archaeon]